MAKLIGMKAIIEHFSGQVSENTVRRWIQEYGLPVVRSDGDKGLVMADSEAVDQWYLCFTLKQIPSFPAMAAEMMAEKIMSRPEPPVKARAKKGK